MRAPPRGRAALALAGATLALLALSVPAAQAGLVHRHLGSFCQPTGIGEAPCQPTFARPYSVAVHQGDGDLVVFDAGGNEKQVVSFSGFGEGDAFKLEGLPSGFGGKCSAASTAAIAYHASFGLVVAGIETELKALCGAANVSVIGDAGKVAIEFSGAFEKAPLGLLTCKRESGAGACVVARQAGGRAPGVYRFKPNGEADPFTALGGAVIDARKGPGGKSCGEEAASCDATPENGFASLSTFPNELQIAVDSSGGATDGDIYVTQKNGAGLHLVDVFAPSGAYLGQLSGSAEGPFGSASRPDGVAVAADGSVFVADSGENKIYRYAPSANPPVNADGSLFSTAVKSPSQLAAGAGPSAGALFAGISYGPAYELGPNGAPRCQLRSGETTAVAVDPGDGDVLISDSKNEQAGTYDYDAAGCSESSPATPITRLSGPPRSGIAVAEASGRVYLADQGSTQSPLEAYGPLAPLPDVASGAAEAIGETTATLTGTVEAHGVEVSECKFEYGPTTAYGSSAPCAESPAEIGTASAEVHADLSGLSSETAYHYRLLAANPNGPADPQGEDRSFQTVSRPELLGSWSEDVSGSEATLKAQINPQSAATTYRFEWGLGGGPYEHVSPEGSIDAAPSAHTVGFQLTGLTAGATYHFRILAESHCHPETDPSASCVSEGPERSLTTYLPFSPETECPNQERRSEASAFLPDCRAYEMVSPVDKNGGDVVRGLAAAGEPGGYVQSAAGADRLTYSSLDAFPGSPAGLEFNQYLAVRGAGGWADQAIHPPLSGSSCCEGLGLGQGREFMAFSADLCSGWLYDPQAPPLVEGGQVGYPNLYRRANCEPGEGGLEALVPNPPYKLPPGTEAAYVDANSLQGLSGDGAAALLAARAKLLPGAAAGSAARLYESSGGALHLASVLPNAAAATAPSEAGSGPAGDLAGAVSEDGSRVYWSAGPLYLRLNSTQPQSGFAAGGASGTGKLTEGSPTVTSLSAAAGIAELTKGSAVVALKETTLGEFLAGQPLAAPGKIPSGTTILSCSPACGKAATSLTLSKAASFTAEAAAITSKGPQPFAVGQTIEAPGLLPFATKIIGAEEGKLTLSQNALVGTSGPVPLASSSACSEAAKACTVPVGPAGARFWAASADGSRTLYTDGSTENGQATLDEFDLGRYGADPASASRPLAAGVKGLLGASRDLGRVYFVSREALAGAGQNGAGEEAEAGAENLYLYERGEGGEPRYAFIARLSPFDLGQEDQGATEAPYDLASPKPYLRATRVSPDGETIAFDSRAPLTGYDNTDTASGRPAVEVYVYDAASGALRCASCNPGGGRPKALASMRLPYAGSGEGAGSGVPAAAWLPTWEHPLHASSALAANGNRLFFNSYDALLPRDTNGQMDVYEWEAPGEGSCSSESHSYFAANGGCLYLISSGESPYESEFWEASEDGRDVFFTTESSLVAPDPGSIDLYDARVEGGFGPEGETFTLKVTVNGEGSVSADSGTISGCTSAGGSACEGSYAKGAKILLTETPGAGSQFNGWGTPQCDESIATTCEVELKGNEGVVASFVSKAKPKFKLTVSKSGTGSGTVTSTPAGINCGSGANCEAEFEEGIEVELKESPAAGSEFKEWTGACSGSGTCKVTMSSAKAVGAVFNLIPRTLSITKTGTGTGEVKCKFNGGSAGACTSPQPNGTAVEVLATANAGSTFAGFSAGTGSAASCATSPCSFTLEANSSLTATFNVVAKPKFKLTVSKSGTGSGTVTSTPAGINCGSGAGCEAEFEEGTEVTLAQAAATGSEFKEWTGACSGTGACKVTMSAAKAVGAVFNPIPRTLAITKAGTGTGEVKCKVGAGSAEPCAASYPNGTALKLEATANPGSTFAAYSAGTGSAAACSTSPCSFTIEANSSVTATFNVTAKPKFKLTVSKSGTGSGTVTSTPAGINCGSGAGCEAEYEEGTEVTLAQAAATGSEFKEWTGACSGTGACKVTMSAAKAVGAVFNPIPRTLAITKAGTGTGEVKCKVGAGSAEPCAASYPNGTALKLEATANPGSTFAAYSAGTGSAASCSTSPCSFAIEANSSVTATFNIAVKPKFKLTVSKSGTGSGTVTSTPAGINCGTGAGCEAEYEEGTEVTLAQAAASGSEFKEWTGACTGSGACKVTISAAKSVGAVFNLIPRTLSITKAGTGTGEVKCKVGAGSAEPCAASYPNGTALKLEATANAGSTFAGFSAGTGSASSCSTSPCSFTLEANSSVTATFNITVKPKFKLTLSKSGTGAGTVTSTPAGIACGSGAGCEAEFEEGTEVTLNQSPAAGSEFKEWTGACSGSGACKVTMSAAKSVGAVFSPIPRTLSITKTGTGTGEVKCKFNGGSAGACTSPQPNGTAVEVIATANAGSTFAGFSAGTGSASSCSTSPCSFTLEANSSVTATFNITVKPKFKLTLSKSGTGAGTVTSTPAGIACGSGAGCEAEFDEGTEVTLNQAAASGSEFKEWSGACTGSGVCKVTMSAAKSVEAVFNLKPKPKFKLSVAKAGTGSGTITSTPAGINCGSTCEAEFEEGTEVTLNQAASPGSEFKEWSGACSGSGTCKVTMSSAKNVGARFNPLAKPKFKLSVSKTGTGTGTITSSPAGIICGAACEHEYEEGTHVTLTESPGAGSEFAGWQTPQCDESTATTCEVVIDGDEALAASFVPQSKPKPEFTLTVEISGNGSGLITCNDTACAASYPEGAKVSLTAVALAGSTFSGWSGGGCSGSGACKVTIEEDTTIVAKFSSKPIVTPPPPLEKGTALASGIAQVQNESALIRLLCPGSARCTGTLELFVRLQDQTHGRRHFRRGSSQATLIGTASFDLAPNSQGTVSVKITSAKALRLLGRGGGLEAQLLGTSVRARSVRLVGARVRRRH